MFRYFITTFLCIFSTGNNLAFAVDTVDEIRTEIEKRTETPFSGTAQEYPDYAMSLGNEILALVDPLLNHAELSQEDKQYLTRTKLFGLQLRYALDNEEYEKKYEEFLDQVQDYALYRRWITSEYDTIYFRHLYDDKAKRLEVFVPLVDRLTPLINKYFVDEKRNDNDQLPTIIVTNMERIDPDGSLGLVRSTVEKLRPVLEADAKRSEYDLLRMCAQTALNSLRRLDMVGKPIEFAPFDIDNHRIDMETLKGKVVLIVPAPYQYEKEKLAPLEKLYKTLKDKGLEMILFSHDNPEIAKERLQSNGESWIVTTRHGNIRDKNWVDYTRNFGTFNFSFIVDREGIVQCARSDGITAELFEALKPFFSEQSENVTKIAADIRTLEEETRKKSQERLKNLLSPAKEKEEVSETLQKLIRINGKISDSAPPEMRLALTNLILADGDLPPKRRLGILRGKVDILESFASKTLANQPQMRPEIAFEEMDNLIDELLNSTENTVSLYNMLHTKLNVLHRMKDYLKTMKSGHEEYADEITRRFVDVMKQAPDIFYHNSSIFIMVYSGDLEEIDAEYSTQLSKSFIKQVVPVFETKKSPEFQQETKRLKNVLRRLELIGSEMEFETMLADGSKINVKDLRGKIVVVNFWATTCGPCLREFPHMKAMYEKYKPQGYEMIAYCCGDDEETLNGFIAKHDYPWLFGSLLKSIDAGLTDYNTHYGITGVPTTMILDRSGKVRFMMVGSNDEIFTRELEKRFAEEP